jgi:hypothetical protein
MPQFMHVLLFESSFSQEYLARLGIVDNAPGSEHGGMRLDHDVLDTGMEHLYDNDVVVAGPDADISQVSKSSSFSCVFNSTYK